MNNKKIIAIAVPAILLIILAVIIADFLGNRPLKRGGNPYEYNVDACREVDPSLIDYKETRNIGLGDRKAGGIDLYEGSVYLTGEHFILALDPQGKPKLNIKTEETGTCIKVNSDAIFIGCEKKILKTDHEGNILTEWNIPGDRAVVTSLAVSENTLYVADAGQRKVFRYDLNGNEKDSFEGKSESDAGHGFIIPSANFDLVIDPFGELWVVNPGKHALENYSSDGNLRGYWQKASMEIDGFTGCCNPAEIACLSDGSFVTSEKGLVRIKVYDQSGKLLSVVAPPDKFEEEGKAPEVAVYNDIIYALDFDAAKIRVFEHIKP